MAITVLPWRHASELAFVRDCFYPHHRPSPTSAKADIYHVEIPANYDADDSTPIPSTVSPTTDVQRRIENYRYGLQRVAIWTFKSPRNVPHAVAATSGLIEARMHDDQSGSTSNTSSITTPSRADLRAGGANHQPQLTSPPVSDQALRSIYAMAFLRFVNGFVDRDVSRSLHRTGLSKSHTSDSEFIEDETMSTAKNMGESSMYAFAAHIGMPAAFVELRHRCVHGAVLPELKVLRVASERALEWLWERWWRGNVVGDAGRWLWELDVGQGEGVV